MIYVKLETLCMINVSDEVNEYTISMLITTMICILHMSGYDDVEHTVDSNCIGSDKHYLKITW